MHKCPIIIHVYRSTSLVQFSVIQLGPYYYHNYQCHFQIERQHIESYRLEITM